MFAAEAILSQGFRGEFGEKSSSGSPVRKSVVDAQDTRGTYCRACARASRVVAAHSFVINCWRKV